MFDMLVKLYNLPPLEPALNHQKEAGIDIRRALVSEKQLVLDWVSQSFSSAWANECDVAFAYQPVACFIAVDGGQIAGFACYDVACRNFFGPTGVSPTYRGRGLGKALLLICLHTMAAQGFAYAIIGGVGPAEFYSKVVGAVPIEGSTPGIFRGWLIRDSSAQE